MKKTVAMLLVALTPVLAADGGAQLREVCSAKANETPVVQGGDGWLFLPAELRHVGLGKFWGDDAAKASKASRPEIADPLPAIVDFKNQLASAGVDLIMVPVPAKAFVYPEALVGGSTTGPAPARMDAYHQQFYDELRKNGITVVDLLPDMLAARNGPDGLMDCKQDTHWSGNATILAAGKVAEIIKAKGWYAGLPKITTQAEARETEIHGDLAGMMTANQPAPEKLRLRYITDESGAPVAASAESPVILLGDSHNLIFSAGNDMLATGAGLPDQLAHELKTPVDLIAVRGSGATPARVNLMRKIKADPGYLEKKKAVIWCFTVREFTEGTGWQKVPLLPKP